MILFFIAIALLIGTIIFFHLPIRVKDAWIYIFGTLHCIVGVFVVVVLVAWICNRTSTYNLNNYYNTATVIDEFICSDSTEACAFAGLSDRVIEINDKIDLHKKYTNKWIGVLFDERIANLPKLSLYPEKYEEDLTDPD